MDAVAIIRKDERFFKRERVPARGMIVMEFGSFTYAGEFLDNQKGKKWLVLMGFPIGYGDIKSRHPDWEIVVVDDANPLTVYRSS